MARKKTDPVQDALDEIAEAKKAGATKLSINAPNLDVARAACEVISVTDLRLSGSLTELPAELGDLVNLEGLSVESNQLTTLPASIGKLTRLTALRAYSNKLTSLPPEIGGLVKLRKAVLWSNQLTRLPPEIGGWQAIVELELKWNKLVELPDEIGQLANLEQLDLEDNELSDLPRTLGGCKKLYRLALADNNFSELPIGILDLPALRELDLSDNQLKALPDELSRLSKLEEIKLGRNQLVDLGRGIYELRNLTSLEAPENQIKSISKDFGKLSQLTTLSLEDNPVEGFSEETLATGREAIFTQLGLIEKAIVEGDLPEDAAAIVKAAKERFDAFERACRKKSHARDMLPKLIAFFSGKTNEVPPIRRDDKYGFSHLPEHLAKFENWTFIDRRMVRYIAGPAFYYRQPGHDYYTGYYEELYGWLKPQLEAEPADSDLFARVVDAIKNQDVDEELILRSSLRELAEQMLREDGSPTSYGRWLIEQAATRLDVIGEMGAKYGSVRDGVTGLLVKHAFDQFAKIADKLLSLDPDDDGDVHAPHGAYDKLCAIDPAKYTPMVLEAVDKAKCLACQAELAKILAERCGPSQRATAFEVATNALTLLSERHNKEDRIWFPFDGRYGDSSAAYVDFVLRNFGREAKDAIFKYTEGTKRFDLDVAEVIAKYIGQDGIEALAEGLNMSFDDDSIAPHFRRMFAMLAPLDWSKYRDKAWELARSELRQVRQTACTALAKLPVDEVLPKALELIGEKKAHLREAGVMIATLLDGDPAAKTLDKLLATEPNDDVRDLIVARRYVSDGKATAAEIAKRVAVAKERGKLDKPAAKWLDEKKLGAIVFKGGKKLDLDTVRWLLYRQTRLADIAPEAEARAAYALIDRDKSAAFAAKLLAGVIKNGGVSAKNRFALSVVGLVGGEDVIETLEELALKTNVNAATTLGLLGSHEAARALDRIMKTFRTKYPNVREAAQDAFDQIAQTLGITRFELADSMIPDFGFTKGEGQITLGKIKARVVIDDARKLVFYDKDKVIKSPGKGLAGKQKEALEALRDEVDSATRTLRTNLEYYMVGGRRWAADKWKAFFLANPLAKAFARSLVWNAFPARGDSVAFRIDDNSALLDRDSRPVTLAKDTQVSLVHPLDLDANARAAWQAILDEQNLAPPFAQMTRSTFSPKDDDRTKTMCFEFENKELEGLTFKSRAERLGWRRGSVVDGGSVSAYRKLFERHQIEVFIGTENLGVQSYDGGEVTLEQLFFVKAGSVATGSYTYDEPRDGNDERLIKLGDLPAIVYSEAIADLRAITHEAQEE